MMGPPAPSFDYYGELQVSRSATLAEITTAYRRLARLHHPDRNPNTQEASTAKFQKVQQAYETLSNQAGRKRYDTFPTTRAHCSCGHCYDEDEYEDWYSEVDDDDDDYYYDFAYGPGSSGAGPRPFFSNNSRHNGFTFGGSRFRSYEDMEKFFQEQERKDAERAKVLAEERQQREAAEARKRKEREDAKRAEEEAIQREKDARKDKERIIQEERWNKAGAITRDEKLAACLHSDNCTKVPQKKKFKCSTCGKKGGLTAFECPFCSSFLCQQCVIKFSERRAKGADLDRPKPKPKPEEQSEEDEEQEEAEEDERLDSMAEPAPEPEPKITTTPNLAPSDKQHQPPKTHSRNHSASQRDIEDKYSHVNGQVPKKFQKKNKKENHSLRSEKNPNSGLEAPMTRPGVKINGVVIQDDSKAPPLPNGTSNPPQGPIAKQQSKLQPSLRPQVNGVNGQPKTNQAPSGPMPRPQANGLSVTNRTALKTNGIPGLQPFPPPAPEPMADGAPDSEAPVDDFNPPSSPSNSSRFRKPYINGPRPQGAFACYICGNYGHLARNCVQPRGCYNCGGTGHMAKYCIKASAANEWQSGGSSIGPDPRTLIPDFQNAYPEETATATKVCIRGATLARGITDPLLRQAMECFGIVTECVIDRKAGIAWTVFADSTTARNVIAASPVPVAKGAVRISEWTGHR